MSLRSAENICNSIIKDPPKKRTCYGKENDTATGKNYLEAKIIQEFFKDVLSNNLEAVKNCIEKGIKVNTAISGTGKDTALHIASRKGYFEIVNFLIKNRGAQALRALDPSHIDTRRISHACISHTSH